MILRYLWILSGNAGVQNVLPKRLGMCFICDEMMSLDPMSGSAKSCVLGASTSYFSFTGFDRQPNLIFLIKFLSLFWFDFFLDEIQAL